MTMITTYQQYNTGSPETTVWEWRKFINLAIVDTEYISSFTSADQIPVATNIAEIKHFDIRFSVGLHENTTSGWVGVRVGDRLIRIEVDFNGYDEVKNAYALTLAIDKLGSQLQKDPAVNPGAAAYASSFMKGECLSSIIENQIGVNIPLLEGYSPVDKNDSPERLAALLPGVEEKVMCPNYHARLWRGSVYDTIIHLNDTHKWPREKIADWIDELADQGYNFDFPDPEEPDVL